MAGRIRSLQSPGVEITEIDKSQIAPSISGTYVLIPGFADKGEDYEILVGNSVDQFIAYYGVPTNEAERYMYYAVKDVVNENATAVTVKIPYDNLMCGNYKAIKMTIGDATPFVIGGHAYLPSGSSSNALSAMANFVATSGEGNLFYNTVIDSFREIESEPVTLSTGAYDILLQANGLMETPTPIPGTPPDTNDDTTLVDLGTTWDYCVVDISKNILSFKDLDKVDDKVCTGMFVAIVDYASAAYVQRLTRLNKSNPDLDIMDLITYIEFPYKSNINESSITELSLSNNKISRKLSDKYMYSSFSEDLMRRFPAIETMDTERINAVSGVSRQQASLDYVNFVTVVVGKLTMDMNASSSYVKPEIVDSYFGSLDENSKDFHTGQSNYICDLINGKSAYIKMFDNQLSVVGVNKRITSVTNFNKLSGYSTGKIAIPYYNSSLGGNGKIGEITGLTRLIGFDPNYDVDKLISVDMIKTSLNKVFNKVSNIDDIQIDVVLDAGLTTIAQSVADISPDIINYN